MMRRIPTQNMMVLSSAGEEDSLLLKRHIPKKVKIEEIGQARVKA